MKILIANDGSKFGQSALAFLAGFIGNGSLNEIKIVTVVEPPAATGVEILVESTNDLTDPENPAAKDAYRTVENSKEVLEKWCSGKSVAITTEVLGGPAARAIVEKADEWKADLIVLGTHGHGFWKRAWLGSVSNQVAHHATCSVLIARTNTVESGAE